MATGIVPPPPNRAEPAATSPYSQVIEQQLTRTGWHLKTVDLAGAALIYATGVLVFFLTAALIDHWMIGLGFWGRLLALLTFVGGSGYYLYLQVLKAIRRINPVYAARVIEQSTPTFNNSLVNMLMFRPSGTPIHQMVMQALQQKAASDLSHVSPDAAIDRSSLIKLGYLLTGVLTICAAYKILSPKDPFQTVSRVIAPWSNVARPSRVQIEDLQPGNKQVFNGQTVKVSAKIDTHGLQSAGPVTLYYSTADGQVVDRPVPMNVPPDSTRHEADLPPSGAGLQQDVVYYVVAGDAISPKHRLTVIPAPTIMVERLDLTFPNYTGRSQQTLERQGDVNSLEGTRVSVVARANQPIKSAFIEFDPPSLSNGKAKSGPPPRVDSLAMTVDGDKATASFLLELAPDRRTAKRSSYQVRFFTEEGHRNEQPILHQIQVIPDLAPEIEILTPTQDRVNVPENGRQKIEVRGVDPDYGVSKITLRAVAGGNDVLTFDLLRDPKGKAGQVVVAYDFVPLELHLKAGDEVTYWINVEDNRTAPTSGLPEPNSQRTRNHVLRIVASDETKRPDQPGAEKKPDNGNNRANSNDPNEKPDSNPNNKKSGDKNQDDKNNAGNEKPGDEKSGTGDNGSQDPKNGNNSKKNPKSSDSGNDNANGNDSGQEGAKNNNGSNKPDKKDKSENGGDEGSQSNKPEKQDQQNGGNDGGGKNSSNKNDKQGNEKSNKDKQGQSKNDDKDGGKNSGQPQNGNQSGSSKADKNATEKGDQNGNQNGANQQGGSEKSGNEKNSNEKSGSEKGGSEKSNANSGGKNNSGKNESGKNESGNRSDGNDPSSSRDNGGAQSGNEQGKVVGKENGGSKEGLPRTESTNEAGGNEGSKQDGSKNDGNVRREDPHPGEVFEKVLENLRKKQQEQEKSGKPSDEKSGAEKSGSEKSGSEKSDGTEKAPAGNQTAKPDAQGKTDGKSPEGASPSTSEKPSGNQPDKNGSSPKSDPTKPDGGKSDPTGAQKPDGIPEGDGKQPGKSIGQKPMEKGDGAPPKNDDKNLGNGAAGSPKNEDGDSGSPQGPPSPKGEGPGPKTGNGTKPTPGAGKNGTPGAGQESKNAGASPEAQDDNVDVPKKSDSSSSKPKEGSEATSPSTSKKQSNSKGGEEGDQSGGGGKGGGQSGNQKGNDSSGNNSPGDEGAGVANEKGHGEDSKRPGDQKRAAEKTGQAGHEKGKGSGTASSSDAQDKANDPAKNPSQKPGPGSSNGAPTGGGLPSDNQPVKNAQDAPVPDGDAANLEYARKATDLAIEHLKNQKDNPDRELLDKLGWTPADLKNFLNRWESMKRAANDPKQQEMKRELDESLKSLGLRPQRDVKRSGGATNDAQRGNRDSGTRSAPPASYQDQFNAFRKGTTRAKEE